MTKELKVLGQLEVLGKELDYYNNIDEPMFLAKDIAEWLQMDKSNASRMVKTIDEDEYITARHNMTNATFLTEDGVYEVLMQSRKPIAKQLKKGIKNALKEIRKNGLYVSDEATIEQKSYNYNLLDLTFSKVGAEFFAEEYDRCIEWHVQNKTRLEYERTSKTRRSDKKLSVADSKIKIMNAILKIAKEREHQYRSQYKFELKSLMSECVKTIELDIKSVKHNQTRGKLAQASKKLA